MNRVLLRKNWTILKALAWTDFKLRYQGSFLGYLWTLVKPLLLFAVLYVVFSIFMRFPVENYQLYLLLGIILWNFFAEATSIGMHSFLAKSSLITKIYFPRYIVVVASTLTSLFTLILNLFVFFVFLWFSPIPFSFHFLFFIIYLLELYFISLGVVFILSVMFVKLRDLAHIWEILLQIGFWTIPIIYPIALVPERFHRFVFLNPLSRIITYSRAVFIDHHIPSFKLNLILFVMTGIIFGLGLLVYWRKSSSIAENI